MELLSIENLIDIREAITRRMQELSAAVIRIPEASCERDRKKSSLSVSLGIVQERIECLEYEQVQKPHHTEGDDVYLCPRCSWEGLQKNTDTWAHGSYNLRICPTCGEHNLKKL